MRLIEHSTNVSTIVKRNFFLLIKSFQRKKIYLANIGPISNSLAEWCAELSAEQCEPLTEQVITCAAHAKFALQSVSVDWYSCLVAF